LNPPSKRRILCVCDPRPGQTSGYRLTSFRRLGQQVIPLDISSYEPDSRALAAIKFRLPIRPLVDRINRDLLRAVREHQPDVVWFDRPLQFTSSTIEAIKQSGALTIYFNQDNPFGPRNDPGWYRLYKVFRLFDLYCAIRNTDIVRFRSWGLPWVRIMLSYEPPMHYPPRRQPADESRARGVSYVGSPYEERPDFLRQLGEKMQLPLVIAGPRWQKVFSPQLLSRYVSHGYLSDSAYREAIWHSRINLSFITRLNEEDIGHKSVEIAACQGFLLALRTPGHQAIFEEDREAVFFSSVEECADKCRFYLNRPDLREAIARRGRERAARSGYDNDTQLARILNRLDGADVP
jgi:spore maturation protein CgeB